MPTSFAPGFPSSSTSTYAAIPQIGTIARYECTAERTSADKSSEGAVDLAIANVRGWRENTSIARPPVKTAAKPSSNSGFRVVSEERVG